MLSIGRLAVGQADYYLEQAHGSLTRAAAVTSGVEDYYLDGPEAPGVWAGAGAAALGLRGTVAAGPLDRVLRGEHPATSAPLGRVLSSRRPGFDLTLSAPKSLSVLFGVGDDDLRAVLRDAHDRAVAEALGYVERHAAVARRGAGGLYAIVGNGLVAAAFRHRTSRAGDPQLHTHVLVANLTLGADGQWSTLDGRRIYSHAKTAGYLYEARLRSLLTRELGVEWTPVRNGIADIAGMPSAVLRAFSRRRAEIEAELERHGGSGARAAEVAALQTRRRKDYAVTPGQLVPEWRERASRLGLTRDVVRSLCGLARSLPLDRELLERTADELAGPTGLTRERSTFTRHDVVQDLCARLPADRPVAVREVERLADLFLSSPRVVVLADGERREVLRRADGCPVPAARSERVYSTPELLALERRILDYAVDGQRARPMIACLPATEHAIERRPSLSAEQAAMVRRLTLSGDAVAVVVGPAGSGKTFALTAAREAWEASGRRVYGAALARRAAGELEQGSGIRSTSVAALLDELDRRPYTTLPRRSVLVIDEAAMLPTRQLAQLVAHAQRASVKLVLVGDHRQLPEIGAGGAFRGLLARLPVIELTENRRQLSEWERDALALLRDGHAKEAVARYEQAGRIVLGDDARDLRSRLVADWWAAHDPDGAVMIAQRRVDVAHLNGRAHALMRATGALGTAELNVGDAAFSAGDRVLVRRNDRRLGVVNGDRGTVTFIDPGSDVIELDVGGRHVTLGPDYLHRPTRHGQPALQHGYALTAHLAQGMTCRQTFVLAIDPLTREAGYVALSRGRESNRLYAVRPEEAERAEYAPTGDGDRDARAALIDGLSRSQAHTLAADHVGSTAPTSELAACLRERDHLNAELARVRVRREQLVSRPPAWFRRRARGRHAADLTRTAMSAEQLAQRVEAVSTRLHALRAEFEDGPTRPLQRVERAAESRRYLFGERGHGRDVGFGH